MKVLSLESIIITKTLQLLFFVFSGFTIIIAICAKKKATKGTPVKAKEKGGGKTGGTTKKDETEDDVKFNLNIKPVEQKRDEFDDDEENPLAKIPTKPRIPKQKTGDPSKASTSTGSKVEPEASFFAPHEKTNGASCYMVKTANTATSATATSATASTANGQS